MQKGPSACPSGVQRLLRWSLIALISLVVLELGLWLAGRLIHRERDRSVLHDKADLVIYCAGDSFTEGVGAPFGCSYPEHLEGMLKTRGYGHLEVENAGRGGCNSAQILKHFLLSTDAPDVLILLVGWNDEWNLWGQAARLGHRNACRDWLRERRIVRLGTLIAYNLRKKMQRRDSDDRAVPLLEPDEFEAAAEAFERSENDDARGAACLTLGVLYLRETDNNQALEWFERGIRYAPDITGNYLGAYLAREVEEGEAQDIEYLELAAERGVGDLSVHSELCDYYLRKQRYDDVLEHAAAALTRDYACPHIHEMLRDLRAAKPELSERIDALVARFPACPPDASRHGHTIVFQDPEDHKAYSGNDTEEDILRSVAANLDAFASICRTRGITLMLMNYPINRGGGGVSPLHLKLNSVIAAAAKRHGLPLVNNASRFAALGEHQEDFFSDAGTDHHPNSDGYALVASNACRVILEQRLLAPPQ